MPLDILDLDERIEYIDGDAVPPTFHLRASPNSRHPVELLRVRLDETLGHWLRPTNAWPVVLQPRGECELRFEVLGHIDDVVSGTLDLDSAEGPFSAVRTLQVSLWPLREFAGAFAADFGASRFAAAYIAAGDGGRVRSVEFGGGEAAIDSTFLIDMRQSPPRGSDRDPMTLAADDAALTNLIHRPRQLLLGNSPRNLAVAGQSRQSVPGAQIAAWALAGLLRRVDRLPRPGRPRSVTVPASSSLTPAQVGAFERAINATVGVRGRVNADPDRRLMLDEATASAFAWANDNREFLSGRLSPGGSGLARLFVIDAGASSVDVSLLELELSSSGTNQLTIVPRQLAKDAFSWLAGDRVTAQAFRLLRATAAAAKIPDAGVRPGPQMTEDDDALAESILPSRFAGKVGRDRGERVLRFLHLIRAAERAKEAFASQGTPTCDLRAIDPSLGSVPLSSATVETMLEGDVKSAQRRLESLLIRNDSGGRWGVDILLVTGEASRLPLFTRGLIAPLAAQLKRSATDWSSRGKRAVAEGAALASYYHMHTSEADRAANASQLVFDMSRFHLSIPFGVWFTGGGYLQPLLAPGSSFESSGNAALPRRLPAMSYQQVIPFFRSGGGASAKMGESFVGELMQSLGQVTLPPRVEGASGAEWTAILLPDHNIEVEYAGRRIQLESIQAFVSPLDSPFDGRL